MGDQAPPGHNAVKLDIRGEIAHITINRPDRMNSLALPDSRDRLLTLLDQVETDKDVKVVILRGTGEKAFCTGWDMESIEEYDLAELAEILRKNLDFFFKIWNLRQPVIAAINGYAVAAGATLAMACDLAIAAEHAKMGEPEIRHYALSPLLMLPFLTHSKPLHRYYYTGDLIDAEEMHRLGLVNDVVPAEDLDSAVWKLAERLTKVPAYPLQMTKRSLRRAYDLMGFRSTMQQHAQSDALVLGADLPAQQELMDILAEQGMRAFLEARDGPFKQDQD